MEYGLEPQLYGPSYSLPGAEVLLRDDLRRCVVFIGIADSEERGGIKCLGSAFFQVYASTAYLVTAQHIAAGLGDSPYIVRLNRLDGSADNIHIDPITDGLSWFSNTSDPNVDLAVMPFMYALREAGYDSLFLPQELIFGQASDHTVGVGDFCYTVGLFQLLQGKERNLPVVHRGSMALLAGEENIPVDDWLKPDCGNVRYIDAHLVETQSQEGLSGAPVFCRSSIDFEIDKETILRCPERDICLLGVWQGSWKLPPGEVHAAARRPGTKVPVGMGCVVPAQKLVEIFEMPDPKKDRDRRQAATESEKIASPDSVSVPASSDDRGPTHKEDFTRLLNAAARKREPGD